VVKIVVSKYLYRVERCCSSSTSYEPKALDGQKSRLYVLHPRDLHGELSQQLAILRLVLSSRFMCPVILRIVGMNDQFFKILVVSYARECMYSRAYSTVCILIYGNNPLDCCNVISKVYLFLKVYYFLTIQMSSISECWNACPAEAGLPTRIHVLSVILRPSWML
jgi:hypothetical protein